QRRAPRDDCAIAAARRSDPGGCGIGRRPSSRPGYGSRRMNRQDALASVLESDVSRETMERLELYAVRLTEWNRRINLVAPADMPRLWQRHILDCAQLHRLAPANVTWLDFGSGAGLPGLVVAILRRAESGHMHLVESNKKKADFLASMVAEMQLQVSVHGRRVEDLHNTIRPVGNVSAHAVASQSHRVALAEPRRAAGAPASTPRSRE